MEKLTKKTKPNMSMIFFFGITITFMIVLLVVIFIQITFPTFNEQKEIELKVVSYVLSKLDLSEEDIEIQSFKYKISWDGKHGGELLFIHKSVEYKAHWVEESGDITIEKYE